MAGMMGGFDPSALSQVPSDIMARLVSLPQNVLQGIASIPAGYGGIVGGGGTPVGASGNAAPAPAPAPQEQGQDDQSGTIPQAAIPQTGGTIAASGPPPVYPKRNVVGDTLDNILLGGAIQKARATEFSQQMANYNIANLQRYIAGLPPAQQRLAAADPQGFLASASANVSGKPGDFMSGPATGPNPIVVPQMSIQDGTPVTQTPWGITQTGPRLPGTVSADQGLIIDKNLGVQGTYSTPQKLGPGENGLPFTPSVQFNGQSFGIPQVGQPQPAGQASPAVSGSPGLQRMRTALFGYESGNNLNAPTSSQNAHGIGQITPALFSDFANPGENINNPTDAANVADRALANYWTRYNGDPRRVATAWFSGRSNVAPQGAATPWRRNPHDANGVHVNQYVANVMSRFNGAAPGNVPNASIVTGSGPQGAPQQAAPAAQAGSGFGPVQARGAVNRDIPPAEAIQRGLAPGRWQQDPTGKIVPVSQPPKADLDRIGEMGTALDTADNLVESMKRFNTAYAQLPKGSLDTGLPLMDIHLHGMQVNPIAAAAGHKAGYGTMEGESNQQLFLMKKNGQGRIMQSEIPIWRGSVQSIDNEPGLNQQRYQNALEAQAYMRGKSNFYQNWVYSHGNLQGADQAWSQQQNAAPAAAPAAPQQAPRLPAGMTPDMARAQAAQAIKAGRNRAQVLQRLQSFGVPTGGL